MSVRGGQVLSHWFTRGWRVIVVCVPAAAAAAVLVYSLWRARATRNKKGLKGDTKKAAIVAKANGSPAKPVESSSGLTTDQSASSPAAPVAQSKPAVDGVDLSDSGFGEPGTPLVHSDATASEKPRSSQPVTSVAPDTPPQPSPPDSAVSSTPIPECTTTLRGGRARSTIHLPLDVIGRFIGRQGRNIKSLMTESGAQIHVQQKNVDKEASTVPCIIQGTQAQISKALDIICIRHPEISIPLSMPYQSPTTFTPSIAPAISSVPPATASEASWDYQLNRATIPTSTFLAIVTYIEKLNRVWLVPYSNTQLLEDLHSRMLHTYGSAKTEQDNDEVELSSQFVAVRVSDIYWLRGRILKRVNEEDFEIQLTDYGSSVVASRKALKPLRREHIQLAIQAFPCLLANIDPINCDGEDGMLVLQALVEGTVMDVHVGSTEGDLPVVELYTSSRYGAEGQAFINRELVDQGFAVWKESSSPIVKPVTTSPSTLAKCEEEEAPISDTPPVSSISLSDLLPLVGSCSAVKDDANKTEEVLEKEPNPHQD